MDILTFINAFVGVFNFMFVIKLIFSDIKELRDAIGEHLSWHLNGDEKIRRKRRKP